MLQAMKELSSAEVVCTRVVESGLYANMVDSLNSLNAQTLNDPQLSVENDFVQAQVDILHNVLRYAKPARGAFRQKKAVEVMQHVYKVTDSQVSLFTYFGPQRNMLTRVRKKRV